MLFASSWPARTTRQLDVGAVLEELTAQGYGDDKLEALGGHIGFADSVTVEQLAAAGVPYRTVFHLRRRLDPRAAAAEVRGSSGVYYVSFVVFIIGLCLFVCTDCCCVLLLLPLSRLQWTGGTAASRRCR